MPRRKRVIPRPAVGRERAYDLGSRLVKTISGPASPPVKVERPKGRFEWRRGKLVFCIGRRVIAKWPAKDKDMILAMVQSKMFVNEVTDENGLDLSTDQTKVLSLARKLRQVLLKAETGTRQRAVYKMRLRLERLYLSPSPVHDMAGTGPEAKAQAKLFRKVRRRQQLKKLKTFIEFYPPWLAPPWPSATNQ